MYNNFLSIQNPNPLLPSMMIPPMIIAPVMLPGIPGPVPMMPTMMNPGQMPTNYQNFVTHNTVPTYSQNFHHALGAPRIPAPVASNFKRIVSSKVFHSLVGKRLLKYSEQKTKKDSVEIEVIDLVSDDEEEEEIIVVDSPRIENSILDVATPQDSGRHSGESESMEDEEEVIGVVDLPDVTTPDDSGRFSGEPDAPQTNEEKPDEESMKDGFIVVDSSISSEKSFEKTPCLDNHLKSNSEAPTIKRKRKYLADGDELADEQIKKWLKNKQAKIWYAATGKKRRMERLMMELESGSGDH